MKKLVVILATITLFFVFSPKESQSAGTHLVIGSFRVASDASTTDEYVEIYNPTATSWDIAGWQLIKKTSSGSKYNLVASFPTALINPGESLVVGHKDSAEKPDIFYTSGYSISEDNTILLYGDAGVTIVDKVGFGTAGEFEGKAMPQAGKSLWQRTSGVDTDNNFADFKKVSQFLGDYNGICLSEIFPRPGSGTEEWIEIYNSEMAKDIGGLVISDKAGSTKRYIVPAGTIIGERKYLVFYKKNTGITLNDDKDGVVLVDATDNIFDDSGDYIDAEQGASYAASGGSWFWSLKPTPGEANAILIGAQEGSAPSISAKKRESKNTTITSSLKGILPEAEVKGETADYGTASKDKNQKDVNDKLFGIILIGVAIIGALIYTIAVNKEKLIEIFKRERRRYAEAWRKQRSKIPRR